MLIVADKHIPYLLPRLRCFGEVQLLEPEQITRQAVEKADALIVRTKKYVALIRRFRGTKSGPWRGTTRQSFLQRCSRKKGMGRKDKR